MRVAVGVLTHDQFKYDRHELFKQTLLSLFDGDHPYELFIVDNGSTDGTRDYVRDLGGLCIDDPITTCGHGMNVTIGVCVNSGADLVVFSNDDIHWHPGALEQIVRFWGEAPEDVLICSGSLEPDYPWNTARERIESGGVKGLIRDTAPGGTWTLRAKDWNRIGPVPETKGWDDVPTCQRLKEHGFRVAQIDAADHVGEGHSTWGNGAGRMAQPLNREAWGL